MSTADKLNKLLETKEAIKQAIIDKGGTVGDVFADYPTAIQNIQSGGSGTFVVPAEMKFAYSETLEEFPEDWDWSEMEQSVDQDYRFYSCKKLTKVPKLIITNATDTSYMISYCGALVEIDMSDWDLSKVTTMSNMFSECKSLKSVKWGEFNTIANKNFQYIFNACNSIQDIPELDFSGNTSTYSSYNGPLYYCYCLRHFGGFKNLNKSIYVNNCHCLSYESLLNIINGLADGVSGQTLTLTQDLVNLLSDEDIAIATNKGWSISPAKSIASPIVVTDSSQVTSSTYTIAPRNFDFSQHSGALKDSITSAKRGLYYFEANVPNVANWKSAFSGFTSLRYVNLINANLNTGQNVFDGCTELREITGLKGTINNAYGMFEKTLIESVDLSELNILPEANLTHMFTNCKNITEIPQINVGSPKNINSMFSGTNITTADLRGWDLSKVTDMSYMFENCYKLTSVMMDSELSPNLTVIYSMFENITTEGTFYYNPAYDYSKIIAQLPATWTAVPLTE